MAKAKLETKTNVGQSTISKTARSLYDAIISADSVIDDSFVSLAENLHKFSSMEYYQQFGYSRFTEFAEKEVRIGSRKSEYMVKIWNFVKDCGIPTKEVKKLGWSKMKEVARVASVETAKAWMEKAKMMSTRDLIAEVKKHKNPSKPGDENGSTTEFKFTVDTDESTIVTDATNLAKTLGAKTDADAMLVICQEWMEFKGESPVITPLDTMLKYMAANYGVILTVAEQPESAEVAAEKESKESAKRKETKKKTKPDAKPKKSRKIVKTVPPPDTSYSPERELDRIIGTEPPPPEFDSLESIMAGSAKEKGTDDFDLDAFLG